VRVVAGDAGVAVSVTAGAISSLPARWRWDHRAAGWLTRTSYVEFGARSSAKHNADGSGERTCSHLDGNVHGNSGSISHSATLALTVQAAPMTNALDVTTYHYNVSRDGLNAKETILTQANVNSAQFGKIGFDAVDGKVDAQPLYLANVAIAAIAQRVYVATEHDSVYAFDADSGAQIWKTSILGSGETTSDDHGCFQITLR